MARIPSPLWLPGAVIYTAVMLLAAQPRGDVVLLPVNPANETIKAKQPPSGSAQSVLPAPDRTGSREGASDTAVASLPPLPRPEPRKLKLGQWAEVVGYTAIARARPDETGHVLAGYPVGQPFRVIARDGAFVRVQDLRSGQLGWIRATSLAPYSGYERRAVQPPILIATAPLTITKIEGVEAPEPQVVADVAAVSEQPAIVRKPRHQPFALAPADEAVGDAVETGKPGPILRVAARIEGDSFPALMQRAFSGY